MIILKDITLILIIITCSYLGISKAKNFENRVEDLNKFQNALIMFKSKIEFTYEPLKNIFEDISKVIYKDEENMFIDTIKSKQNIYSAWCEAIDITQMSFNKEDKEIIKMLGKLLGKTDINGQVSEINLTMNLIEKQIEKAEIEKTKNVKLYKTMGVILGMGICIILI